MHDRDKIDRLNQLVDDMFSPTEPKYAGQEHPPFAISQVALHKAKHEFLGELKIIEGTVKHLNAVLKLIDDGDGGTAPKKARTQEDVDMAIRNGTRR